jgi:hypothetical protein
MGETQIGCFSDWGQTMEEKTSADRLSAILAQLPEKQYALFRLGWALFISLQQADIAGTVEDREYIRGVARRISNAVPPLSRQQFVEWFEPGGVLRLWTE